MDNEPLVEIWQDDEFIYVNDQSIGAFNWLSRAGRTMESVKTTIEHVSQSQILIHEAA